MSGRTWSLPGESHVRLDDDWLAQDEADRFFAALTAEIPWRHDAITLFGRRILQPRLTCWMGDADAVYTYSGLTLAPVPWSEDVAVLRARAGASAGERFNAVLLNLYRDGKDSMGFHSDDEPELGPTPCIASVSLGASRTFVLRPRRARPGALPVRIPLGHGSLLVMSGGTQREFSHGIPKEARAEGPRVNLTFRRILSDPTKRARDV